MALKMRGEIQPARDQWEHAVGYARSTGLRQIESRCLMNLGNLCYEQGDLAGAQRQYEQALSGAEAVADSYTVGRLAANLGNIQLARGDLAGGLQQLDQALAIKQRTGDRRGLVATNIQRARALLGLGRGDAARALAESVQAEAGRSGEARLQAYALLLLGQIRLYEGLPDEARETIAAGLALPDVAADVSLCDDLTNYLALALIACGDIEAAGRLAENPLSGSNVEVAIERKLIGGVLALAGGDRAAVSAIAADVAEQAATTGYLAYVSLAQRLATAAAGGSLAALPRILLGPGRR
jgi:tetratricopeptide (TPR) repeat protein